MHHSLKLLIITSLITGCSTVESEYIENNTTNVEAYTEKYQKELEDLAGFLVDECTMKKMSANKNMKLSDLGKYFLDGRVIYQLDPSGKITNAIYEKKGRSQKECVSKFSVGYQLPNPEGLQYVYGTFTLEING
jgi:hypothetical protein